MTRNRPDWMEPLDLDWGFSGSRDEPSKEQKNWLLEQMLDGVRHKKVVRVHHGCCIGSDAFMHRVAKSVMDMGLGTIVLHPPSDRSREMEIDEWTMANCLWYPRKPYLTRNKEIVRNSSRLLATPKDWRPNSIKGSGTWHTIRAAMESEKPVSICLPDGEKKSWVPSLNEWIPL